MLKLSARLQTDILYLRGKLCQTNPASRQWGFSYKYQLSQQRCSSSILGGEDKVLQQLVRQPIINCNSRLPIKLVVTNVDLIINIALQRSSFPSYSQEPVWIHNYKCNAGLNIIRNYCLTLPIYYLMSSDGCRCEIYYYIDVLVMRHL